MRLDELCETIVDGLPHLARHHGFEWRRRKLQVEIAVAHVPAVDNDAVRLIRGRFAACFAGLVSTPNQEIRDLGDRLLRSRQPDALRALPAERAEALERQGE